MLFTNGNAYFSCTYTFPVDFCMFATIDLPTSHLVLMDIVKYWECHLLQERKASHGGRN